MNPLYPTSPSGTRGCAGFRQARALSRRGLLQVGGLGFLGLGLTDLLLSPTQGEAARKPSLSGGGKAKSCIFMFMWGGPSQLDTWDLKPQAPADVRGEFKPISTSVPGIHISEHFPLLAQQAHRYAIIRSMTHDDPAHLSSAHHLLTGWHAPHVKSDADAPSRKDSPHVGAMLGKLLPSSRVLPPFVTMPWFVSHPAAPGGVAPGQNGGWLGLGHDPFLINGDPNAVDFTVTGLDGGRMASNQLDARQKLLERLDKQVGLSGGMTAFQRRAFALLGSAATCRAFDLKQEPDRVRDSYGRNTHGQCLLLARRLIEAGVRLVNVHWYNDGQFFWDTHDNNFPSLKHRLMPPTDRGFSALLEDLSARGLLEETLLVWVGEIGRTPRINNARAGREHWSWCYPAVLAGGGIRGGQVYGRSDGQAAYPAENPVTPGDLVTTIYHALGVSPDTTVADRDGRPIPVCEGTPLRALFS